MIECKFKVGDRVKIVSCVKDWYIDEIGQVKTVESIEEYEDGEEISPFKGWWYHLEGKGMILYYEKDLRLYNDKMMKLKKELMGE